MLVPTIDKIAIELRDSVYKKHGKYTCWKKFIPSARIIWNDVYGPYFKEVGKIKCRLI